MNYQQAIDYLYNALPMFTRMGSAAYKKDLTNIRMLCGALDNPQHHFKTIHVAGTNGKGSVSHMLAAVLQGNGLKTGLYTSPHLYDFRERIRINGNMVSEDFVCEFVSRIQPLSDKIQPSFFEITVAMAFQYFFEQKTDIAIIEVGLGGRLDSTNIICPELSIITNIGWDHTNILGNTMEAIAGEKAGIIKERIPVVIGEWQNETAPVFERKAGASQAPLYFAKDHFEVVSQEWKNHTQHLKIRNKTEGRSLSVQLDLPGTYQAKNICTVLTALWVLYQHPAFPYSLEEAPKWLQDTRQRTGLMGRWERIREQPAVILEVAHNKEGIAQMVQQLETISYDKLHLVFGMVKDKEPDAVLSILPKNATYYFTQAQLPRALPAEELRSVARPFGLAGIAYPHVNAALQSALTIADPNDLIIVCGSIFLVAEVDKGSFAL